MTYSTLFFGSALITIVIVSIVIGFAMGWVSGYNVRLSRLIREVLNPTSYNEQVRQLRTKLREQFQQETTSD